MKYSLRNIAREARFAPDDLPEFEAVRAKRQYPGIYAQIGRARYFSARAQQEGVPHEFGLLFDAVAPERPAGTDDIGITAEGMAGERQAHALLVLPDVRPLMNEQPLQFHALA